MEDHDEIAHSETCPLFSFGSGRGAINQSARVNTHTLKEEPERKGGQSCYIVLPVLFADAGERERDWELMEGTSPKRIELS